MNIMIKCFCRGYQLAFRLAMPLLPIGPEIRREDVPAMAAHAAREANPLYPVPKLMDRLELEIFYEKAADWSR